MVGIPDHHAGGFGSEAALKSTETRNKRVTELKTDAVVLSSPSLLHPGGSLRVVWRRLVPRQPVGPAPDDAAVCAGSAAPGRRGGQRGPLLALCGVSVHREAGGGDHS